MTTFTIDRVAQKDMTHDYLYGLDANGVYWRTTISTALTQEAHFVTALVNVVSRLGSVETECVYDEDSDSYFVVVPSWTDSDFKIPLARFSDWR